MTKATSEVGKLYTFIEHKGASCIKSTDNQLEPCTYAIELRLPSHKDGSSVSHFSLVAHHNETSHIKLREGISVEQIVQNHETRYFQFIVYDNSATNVTFTLNSHHGDSDLYVSRLDKFPDAKNFEKKSSRSSRFADEVSFDKVVNQSLMGVYFVGVQGFEYSSYSLRASIVRGGESSESIVPVQLTEGIAQNEFLKSKSDKKYFQFKTQMYGNTVSDIRISVTPVVGEFSVYVKSGEIPTLDNYDFKAQDGSDIIMWKDSANFKPVGMKYVLVVPASRYGAEDYKDYRFTIKYATSNSISVIVKDAPAFGNVQIGKYDYFRYHSITKVNSLTVSLTSLSGDANLVVSIDPSNEFPTKTKNSYHSMKEGKDSIELDGSKLFDKNPSCNPNQASLLGSKACNIYIGVYCGDNNSPESRKNDSCSYTLKVYEGLGLPHMLIDGVPQKDHVKQAELLTYYMPILADKDYLYIAATSEIGDVNIYVTFADQEERSSDLALPTRDDHMKKSKHVAHSQLVHFTKKELKKNCAEFSS